MLFRSGGAGGVGSTSVLLITSWGQSGYGENTWNADTQPFPTSDNGTGNTGTVNVLITTTWGGGGYGEGQWN